MPVLFHYSRIGHLPAILTEGLCKGELAGGTARPLLVDVVSLTSQSDPDRLNCWGAPCPEKTAVRFTCRIPDGDPQLEGTRDAWKRLRVPKYRRDACDPHG